MAIGDYLIGKYTLDHERDLSRPPSPQEDYEHAAMKLIEFVAVTPENRVDTTCTLSDEAIASHRLRSKLSLVKFGFAIVLRRKADNKTINLTKQKADTFIALDNERRLSRNLAPISVHDILDQCYDAADDDKYTLTVKDKKKCRKKHRIARKKLNDLLYDEAKEVAGDRRLKRNLSSIADRLSTKRPRFFSKLKSIMEEEEIELEDVYAEFEDVALEPFSDTVSVERGDTTKEIDVSFGGRDVLAVSHKMETTLMKVMVELKAKMGEKEKRKRRRYPCQSTHLGKSGIVAGILIQRQVKEEELKAAEKQEKGLTDEIERMRSIVDSAKGLAQQLPDTHWHWDKVKGDKRKILAKLFGVYKSSAKADELKLALKSLNLSKQAYESKLEELESLLAKKRHDLPPMIANRREQEDFLDSTKEYVDASTATRENDESDEED
eukprot:Sro91_g047910.1 n/a (437) ;mRNA; r:113813-115123